MKRTGQFQLQGFQWLCFGSHTCTQRLCSRHGCHHSPYVMLFVNASFPNFTLLIKRIFVFVCPNTPMGPQVGSWLTIGWQKPFTKSPERKNKQKIVSVWLSPIIIIMQLPNIRCAIFVVVIIHARGDGGTRGGSARACMKLCSFLFILQLNGMVRAKCNVSNSMGALIWLKC